MGVSHHVCHWMKSKLSVNVTSQYLSIESSLISFVLLWVCRDASKNAIAEKNHGLFSYFAIVTISLFHACFPVLVGNVSLTGSPILSCVVQQPEAAALCLFTGALHTCNYTAVLQDLRPTSQGSWANPTDPDIHSRGKVFPLFCFVLLSCCVVCDMIPPHFCPFYLCLVSYALFKTVTSI